MTRKTTLAAVALATLAGSGLLSGCAGTNPGVAARIGDETISVNRVNEITRDYCSAYRRSLEGEAQALPLGVLSTGILQRLTMQSVARQMADEAGVTPTAQYAQSLADLTETSAVLGEDEAAAKVEVETAAAYVTDILTSVGGQDLEEDGGTDASGEDSLARGQELLDEWLGDNDIEIDPQYAFELVAGQPTPLDTSTSFAVSDLATAGASLESDVDYARDLPASQRCP